MEKIKKILEGIYGWGFWILILGAVFYFAILPEINLDSGFDLFSGIKEEAYMEGFNAGRKEGIEAGKESGFDLGYDEGYDKGVLDGEQQKMTELAKEGKTYDAGYRKGYSAGKTVGYTEGYTAGQKTKTAVYTNSAVPEQPEYNYVINKNTKKFHYTWCSSVNDIKSSNRWNYSGMRDDIIDMGYSPCKKCNP